MLAIISFFYPPAFVRAQITISHFLKNQRWGSHNVLAIRGVGVSQDTARPSSAKELSSANMTSIKFSNVLQTHLLFLWLILQGVAGGKEKLF